jgi:tRNA nucleotidyltransferase/poly(A) polymerase
MPSPPPNLADAPWLAAEPVRRVFAALTAEGAEARIIGGAVRNALMGLPVGDIDFATTATPDEVERLAAKARIKVVPTGRGHGTLTLVCHGIPYQVTTLREDIVTDGRHAVVRFGTDWAADARRRDFTINALSVDAAGAVHDPLGGYADVVARRIRFIGNPDQRIAEDRLRILRFFRFNAEYGLGAVDADGLGAAMRSREALRELSRERVGAEMRRIVVAPAAVATVALMQEAGVLGVVLGGIGYVAEFARLAALEARLGRDAAVPLRLAALACRIAEDVTRLTARLKLANAERDRMLAALAAAADLAPPPGERRARLALYRHGAEAYGDGLLLAAVAAGARADDPAWAGLISLPKRWTPPRFPLAGRDVVGAGRLPGPVVGEILKALEAWWIDRDFAADEAALRARLQQMLAAQQ